MRRITLIVDERAGVLKEIAKALGDAGINIEDINAVVVGDKGIITLGVSKEDYNDTVKLLRSIGHRPIPSSSIIIKLEDKPGMLAEVTDILATNDISITNISLIDKDEDTALLVLNTTKNAEAKKLLSKFLWA